MDSLVKNYIPRIISKEAKRLAKLFPVLTLTGPRQSGKTTLCKELFPNYHYVNMENPDLREQIQAGPKNYLERYKKGLIIDEVQNYPELISYVQIIVDEQPEAKYILTGSNNFTLMEKVTQSLAGRTAVLRLLPLSLEELKTVDKVHTDRIIFQGGYPAVWSRKMPVQDVSSNYYETYIERDIRQLLKVKDIIHFQTFIRLCAGRAGTVFNASALSNEVGVSVPTIQEWLSVLEASYISFRLPPFSGNIGKRLIKSPKLYFYDTGLACFLLGIENEQQLATHPLRGALFENMVVLEFFKNSYNQGKLPHLYFYRDKSQREVDLIEEKGTDLYAYEIKPAKTFIKRFLSNLDYFREVVGKNVISTQVVFDGENNIPDAQNGMINFRNIDFNS